MIKDLRKKDFEKLNNRKGHWLIDEMVDKGIDGTAKTKNCIYSSANKHRLILFFFNTQLPVCRARQ